MVCVRENGSVTVAKVEQPEWDCARLIAIQVDQWIPGVLPAIEKGEDCYHNQNRPGLRKDDVPPDAEITAPVNARCLIQFAGKAHEELAIQENAVGRAEELGDHNW